MAYYYEEISTLPASLGDFCRRNTPEASARHAGGKKAAALTVFRGCSDGYARTRVL
ncbi:hypothetical protein GMI69_00110 [Eggerthellaceae bacterium zg-887]|uniref:hypothetical protein n=1 Tax=Xiamenia xianingshaonis TaxID=2682776 RepID=UPI001409A0F7|nr:hypothetical protein [Xiamenia xianingshaonis]NHM15081.1 hypothetical protein [Xiamenia xianingshaonis]